MTLPQDYVNYIKIVRVGTDGIERVLYPARKTSSPFAVTQNDNGDYLFEDTDFDATLDSVIEQSPSNTVEDFTEDVPNTYQI